MYVLFFFNGAGCLICSAPLPTPLLDLWSTKASHTFALLSDEDAGELASSCVFWLSVPKGDSVRQVGDTESMSSVRLLWCIKKKKIGGQNLKNIYIFKSHKSRSMTNVTVALRRAERPWVFSPGMYLVTGRLKDASPSFYALLEFYEWTKTVPSAEGEEGGADWRPQRGLHFGRGGGAKAAIIIIVFNLHHPSYITHK